jgi:glutathione S-transferase
MYKLYGSENSPYSVKVRAFCEYKGIPHQWLLRGQHQDDYARVAKIPIVPALELPDGGGMQDSTPIMEYLDARFPEPSVHPADPALRFLSELVEEFGDEWGNKWMFHYRWRRKRDIDTVSRRLAAEAFPQHAHGPEERAEAAQFFAERMGATSPSGGRGFAVGSNDVTAPMIEEFFVVAIGLLDAHLSSRPFLFGTRPAFGDFGLGHQLNQALMDPTAGDLLRQKAPHVVTWCTAMASLSSHDSSSGDFETWSSLQPTLEPFLSRSISRFLIWSEANAAALARGSKDMTVDLGDGNLWQQTVGGPQKYHAKSLRVLQAKFAAAKSAGLTTVLDRCGCLAPLLPPPSRL